jgi:hypothetical protein
MIELMEVISVISVQAVLCSYPYEAGHILADSMETVIRNLSDGKMVYSMGTGNKRNNQ